jgi:thioredoxin-related protein
MLKQKVGRLTATVFGRYLVWGLVGASLLATLSAHAAENQSIQWHAYEEGLVLGKLENKKLYIHFYADWCRYCKAMEKDTFQDADVTAYLNTNFIPIKVDFDRERQTAAQYDIRPLPDNWFLASNGERISNQPGYIPPDLFIKILQYIHTDSYKDTSFMNFVKRQ